MYNLEKQHRKGKLHAIERIHSLLDEGSFHEIGSGITNQEYGVKEKLPYDGVITGYGEINKKRVYIYSQDFTVLGGTLGKKHGYKIAHVIKLAIKSKCPVIGINDSGGARIQEGVDSLAGYGEIFYYNTLASGYIPQISIMAGPCAGGAVYSPGITDFVFVVDHICNMFVTGPKVIKCVMNQNVTSEELGGTQIHSQQSGVAHFRSSTEADCYQSVKRLLDYIPSCADVTEPYRQSYMKKRQSIDKLLPARMSQSYDMKTIIAEILDHESFFEVQAEYAQNMIIGFGRLSNIVVGIVANQPKYLAGVIDCNASDKAARFIRYCDSYNIPIITFTDVPGFLPSYDQEQKGIIRHGAKLLYAYSEATTIKLNVIVRKAYGGAYIAMCSKQLRADFVYAWPQAEIAVMGAEAAVDIIYAKELSKIGPESLNAELASKIQQYQSEVMNANRAIENGYVDEMIEPNETRERLYHDMIMLMDKQEIISVNKKHGNIPL